MLWLLKCFQRKPAYVNEMFGPTTQPELTIYRALKKASRKYRPASKPEYWIFKERIAIYQAARGYALKHGLKYPTLQDIEKMENRAYGHCDYAEKLARYVAVTMTPLEK